MSTSEVSTRRSRRTPITPSRYGRDFVMNSGFDVKKEPKDTVDVNQRKSPRGSNTGEHVEQAVKKKKQTPSKESSLKQTAKKQVSPEKTTATLTRTTRRGSKRIGNLEEVAQEGLSDKKRQKPSKGTANKNKKEKEEENQQKVKLMSAETIVEGVGSKSSQEHQHEGTRISKSVKQSTPASVSSHSKDQPSAETPESQPVSHPSDRATASRLQSSNSIPSEENQAGNMSSTSSVFKALKEAIVTYRSTPGQSSSKDSPESSTVKQVPTKTSKTLTGKCDAIAKPSSKDKPAVLDLKVQELSSNSQSTETQTPKTQASQTPTTTPDLPSVTTSKASSNSSLPVTSSPVKKIHVNIIRGNQSSPVGLLGEQSQRLKSSPANAVKMVSSPRGKKPQPLKEYSHPFLVTNDMVSKISVKGRTTSTQTTHDDLQALMLINKNLITNCHLKVMRVTPSKVSKPHFRIANSSNRTKHSQTTSQISDLNFIILDAIGREEEMLNERSLSYAGEEGSDVDKKIQWMLFGQDLETAMTNTRGGIPSNVVDKGQTEDKTKPKNAKISIESWSLALTVLNPNV